MWEFFSITAEILYIKWKPLYMMAILIIIAGLLLLVGYWVWYKSLKNLWLIYIVSITSILILEPILIYFLSWELPNLWSRIWFVLWVLWFLSAIFIK